MNNNSSSYESLDEYIDDVIDCVHTVLEKHCHIKVELELKRITVPDLIDPTYKVGGCPLSSRAAGRGVGESGHHHSLIIELRKEDYSVAASGGSDSEDSDDDSDSDVASLPVLVPDYFFSVVNGNTDDDTDDQSHSLLIACSQYNCKDLGNLIKAFMFTDGQFYELINIHLCGGEHDHVNNSCGDDEIVSIRERFECLTRDFEIILVQPFTLDTYVYKSYHRLHKMFASKEGMRHIIQEGAGAGGTDGELFLIGFKSNSKLQPDEMYFYVYTKEFIMASDELQYQLTKAYIHHIHDFGMQSTISTLVFFNDGDEDEDPDVVAIAPAMTYNGDSESIPTPENIYWKSYAVPFIRAATSDKNLAANL